MDLSKFRIQVWKDDLSFYGVPGTGDIVTNAVVIDCYQVEEQIVVIAKLDDVVWQIITETDVAIGDIISASKRDGRYYSL